MFGDDPVSKQKFKWLIVCFRVSQSLMNFLKSDSSSSDNFIELPFSDILLLNALTVGLSSLNSCGDHEL